MRRLISRDIGESKPRSVGTVQMQMLSALLFALSAHLHYTFNSFAAEPREVAFSPDSKMLATSDVDGFVKLWRVSDRKLIRVMRHAASVTSLDFSRDGQSIATGSYDGQVRIWRVTDGAFVRSLKGHIGTVWSVALSPAAQSLASTGEDKTVRVWRLSDGA